MNRKEKKEINWLLGVILGAMGLIFYLSFMAADAFMFGFTPPVWIIRISDFFFLNPVYLDVLSTIFLIAIIGLLLNDRKRTGKVKH